PPAAQTLIPPPPEPKSMPALP
ncbi:hypothetical protein, partial [Mycobacterium tuberculosis]